MNPPRRILVGMDEADLANDAIVAAVELARVMNVPVEVLHACPVHRPRWWLDDENRWASALAEELSHAAAARVAHLQMVLDGLGDRRVSAAELLRVLPGRPADVMAQRADEVGDALLVLGRHRDRGVFDFGGTTRAVLSSLRYPAWLQHGPWSPVRRVLAPVDLLNGSDQVASFASALARQLGADLVVLHCFEPPAFAYNPADSNYVVDGLRSEQRNRFDAMVSDWDFSGLSCEFRFVEGRPAPQVLAMQGECDLIVMGNHVQGHLAQLMLGSQAYQVAREATLPVVVVPLGARVAIG